MKILAICGSTRRLSSNGKLLKFLSANYFNKQLETISNIHELPLFADTGTKPNHPELTKILHNISNTQKIIISTPEYLKNIPAALKNLLEWSNLDSNFAHKTVLPIVYTPHTPRGESAMNALCQSLLALNAYIPAQLLIHQSQIRFSDQGDLVKNDIPDLLDGAIELLGT